MYYRLVGDRLVALSGLVSLERLVGEVDGDSGPVMETIVKNARFLTPDEAASIGAYRREGNAPDIPEGCTYVVRGYTLSPEGRWRTIYDYPPIVYTEEDFNRALEAHLHEECVARGYDTREPTAYASSAVPRWRQDAKDWMAHVDAVMTYGLAALNEWKETGKAPSYSAFVAGLPRIHWTEE